MSDDYSDDYGVTVDTAGAVDVGGSVTGEIGAPRDVDWFALDVVAGHTYVIDLEGSETDAGTLADPQLRGLFGADSSRLPGTTNDRDGGEGLNSRMTWTASETGTVYVAVRGHKDDTGTYTLSVTDTTPLDDFGDTAATAGAIEVGGSVTGEIGAPRDFDWFALDAVAGRTYVIDLEGSETGAGTLADPQVRGLFNAGGRRLPGTTNDRDGGEGLNSRMTWTAGETGTVYVVARGHKDDTGTYTLSVTDTTPPDDFGDTAATAGAIEVGGSVTGEIGAPRDFDWFALDAVAGRTYVIDLEGSETGAGTLADPQLRGLFGAGDSRLPGTTSDRDGGEGLNSRMTWTAGETGTVYVVARGHKDDTGTYTLSVTDVTAEGQDAANGSPAFGEASYAFELEENANGGLLGIALGRVEATDPDGDAVTYSIVSGAAGRFAIDPETGELSYEGTGENPASGAPTSYELTVRASDGTAHSDVAVTVTVTDVEEFAVAEQGANQAPQFAFGSYAFTLDENVAGDEVAHALGLVQATDPDDDPLAYSIEGGNSNGLFAIDAETGALSYVGAGEDYESGTTSYELTVRASDGTAHSDVTVTVNVSDVEEYVIIEQGANQAPQFAFGSYAFTLDENVAGDEVAHALGLVQATDPDDDPLAYSIEGDNSNGLFAIDAETGALSYVGAGEDYESGTTSYELTVRASDGTAHSDVMVTVNVSDVEEYVIIEQGANQAPQFAFGSYAFTLDENVAGDEVALELGLVQATDPDDDPLAYSIEGDNSNGLFEIDAETGALSYVGAGEDYESGTTSYELTVRASDGAAHSDVTVTVNVSDVEDDEEEYVSVHQNASVSEPDGEDLPADTSTTGRVVVGDSVTGEVDHFVDRDWFAVTLQEGKLYRIDLEGSRTGAGTLSDPYLYGIYSASGHLIPWTPDDDDGRGHNSRVLFAAEADATYYVAAGAYYYEAFPGDNGVGTYTLSVREVTDSVEDDFAVGTGTSGMVEVGGSVGGEIEYERDRDWFAVTLEAGRLYRIDLEGYDSESGTLYDPYLLGVYDATGTHLPGTVDDDSGKGANSQRFVMVETDGTYYVGASAVGERYIPDDPEDRLGTYRLSVKDVTDRIGDDFAAGTETSGRVEVGGSVTGEIDYRGDHDWFAVTLEAGTRYQIDLEGTATGAGTAQYVSLYGVYNADGEPLPGVVSRTEAWSGNGWNSRQYFKATEDDTYYVAAGAMFGDMDDGYSATQGTYTLSVEEII